MLPLARRSRSLFIFVLLTVPTGCVVTHPRTVPDLPRLLEQPRRILLLRPDVEVRVKNISTDEYVRVPEASRRLADRVDRACRAHLDTCGHRALPRIGADGPPRWTPALGDVRRGLLGLIDEIIAADPGYTRKTFPASMSATDWIPKKWRGRVDMIAALSVRLRQETRREFWWRWFRNVGWNLATMPISIASAFLPFTMPITINITTKIFEASPDKIFCRLIVVSVDDGRVIYQNDYFAATVPEEDSEVRRLAEDLFEQFGP